MKENHIIDIIDSRPIESLNEVELRTIRVHVESCEQCSQAYEAARIAALLLKERVAEAAENSLDANPFFHTRVMAAWREQIDNVSAFRRLWKATGALVTSMAATTAALAVLSFAVPATDTVNDQTLALAQYSAEAVMLDQGEDQITDEQVLSEIYAEEGEDR